MKSDLNFSILAVSVLYSRHHSHKILEAVTSACPGNRTPIQGILLLTGFTQETGLINCVASRWALRPGQRDQR